MEQIITDKDIICGSCGNRFERSKEFTSCSNCFTCTGCEIYYCPECDSEIVITPVRKAGYGTQKTRDKTKVTRQKSK